MARPITNIEAGREQLLEVVEALIKQRGATSVTLSELAAAAGMSPANIYRFFENKEALFEASAERWFAPKIRAMEEVTASNLPVREKLYDFFARRFVMMRDKCRDDPVLFNSYMELGDEHFEIIRGYIDLGDHYLAMIVAEAMEEGYFKGLTIDQAVSLINLMVQPFCNPSLMVMLLHSVSEEKLAQVIDSILAGLVGSATETVESGNVVALGNWRGAA